MRSTPIASPAGVERESDLSEQGPGSKQHRALASSPALWLVLVVAALIGHFLVAEPGMFPGWDESVFFSQSGDIVGVESSPSYFAPSREPGTPLLIWGMGGAGLNIESIRIGFLVVFVLATAAGFYLLAPILGWGAVAGFAAMVGHWIAVAYSWRFFGVAIAAALLVLAVGAGTRMLTDGDDRRRLAWAGILAISGAGMLTMRHLEGWIGAAVLWLVLLVFGLRRSGRLVRWVLVAGVVSLALFLFVEVLRANHYHGSFAGWLDALRGQLSRVSPNEDTAFGRLVPLLGSLGGAYHLWLQERIPGMSAQLTGVAAALVVIVIGWRWIARRGSDADNDTSRDAVQLVLAIGVGIVVAYLAFFTLAGFPANPRDRYLMWFIAGGALLGGVLLRGSYRVVQSSMLVMALLIWVVGSSNAASFDTDTFLESGEGVRRVGLSMHVLAEGEECLAASRYGAPAYQLASGCRVVSVGSEEEARAWLEGAPVGATRFLAYPASIEFEGLVGWASVVDSESSVALWFREGS